MIDYYKNLLNIINDYSNNLKNKQQLFISYMKIYNNALINKFVKNKLICNICCNTNMTEIDNY